MKKARALEALAALAQETRLDVFRLLVQQGCDGMPAGAIGERLGQPSPTLSFHLNQLRFAGLISSRRASRSIIYSANFKAMNELLAYLTENCCGGRPELCAPERLTGRAIVRSPCAPLARESVADEPRAVVVAREKEQSPRRPGLGGRKHVRAAGRP
jgi:ArsR family transcriptional regulator, arsenate/arsenite/antimonite-responsive transcriptional repressor